jgi:hypothetical protein
VECKKHKGDSFDKIMRQVSVAATMAAEFKSQDDFSVFVIACRGLEIAFFEYYNYHTVLDESNIYHYEGLIPLTCPLDKQEDYFRKLTPLTLTSIPTSQDELTNLGVKVLEKWSILISGICQMQSIKTISICYSFI